VVRAQYVNDPPRVTGHVVYRAVVDKADFPDDLQWNAASIWVGPNCHLVHYPLRGGEQYNVVVTFHSRQQEQWGVTDGSKEEVQSYFQGICPQGAPADRPAQELEALGHRRPRADRHLDLRPRHLLGDAAHPTTQYMAQGACMAMEDAVTLGEALRVHEQRLGRRAGPVPALRVTRTARIVLSSAARWAASTTPRAWSAWCATSLWKGRTPERFYDAHGMAVQLERQQLPGRAEALPAPQQPPETPHERTRPTGRPAAGLPRRTAGNSTWCRCGPACAPCCRPVPRPQDPAHLLAYDTLRPLLMRPAS
jgi:salicylate hydroxylase